MWYTRQMQLIYEWLVHRRSMALHTHQIKCLSTVVKVSAADQLYELVGVIFYPTGLSIVFLNQSFRGPENVKLGLERWCLAVRRTFTAELNRKQQICRTRNCGIFRIKLNNIINRTIENL